MSRRIVRMLFSGAIGLTLAGCASAPIMRAQSPQGPAGPPRAAVPVAWNQTYVGSACPSCQASGAADCHHYLGYDSREFINLPFHPVHRNSYTYNVPRGLMYPPAPSPAGIYQYPYYTLRGPTDFFME